MNELFVQTTDEVAYDFIEFAKAGRYGIEITSFALPWILDGDWETLLRSYKQALKDFGNEVAIHGVFMENFRALLDTCHANISPRCRSKDGLKSLQTILHIFT